MAPTEEQREALARRGFEAFNVVADVRQTGQGRAGIEVTMDVAFLFEADQDGRAAFIGLLPDHEKAMALAREREG
jgi:hypothetical protein